VSYYRTLTEKAERRERHAKWIIDRFNLSEKRNEFLEQDRSQIEHQIEVEGERRKNPPPQSSTSDATRVDTSTASLVEFASVAISGLDETDQSPAETCTNGATSNLLEEEDEDELSVSYNEATIKTSIWDDIRTESTSEDVTEASASKNTQIYDADQSLSEAKDILYPEAGEASLMLSYQEQYESGVGSSIWTRELLGSTAFEGSTAKNIIYSTGQDVINLTQPLKARGEEEGTETKNLLYPSEDKVIVAVPEHSSKAGEEGTFTKSLLYPGESSDSTHKHINIDQRQVEDGAETKGLLYGHNIEVSLNKSTRGGMRTDYGQEVKDMLYPSSESMETRGNVMPLKATRNEGVETKDLIYPGEHFKHASQPGPTILSSTEGSEAKSLLYPSMSESGSARPTAGKPRQFENPSVVHDLLYHSGKDDGNDVSTMKSRGFEPPTRIKEMMYPVVEEKSMTFFHSSRATYLLVG